MNRLVIIGNGFDINLGMKTRYQDFYKYYIAQLSSDIVVEDLKNSIEDSIYSASNKSKNDSIDWSDMELGFGEYTKRFDNEADAITAYYDLKDHLSDYLKAEEDKIKQKFSIDKDKFGLDLTDPQKYLLPEIRNQIIGSFQGTYTNPNIINILTFNYTHSLELIMGEEKEWSTKPPEKPTPRSPSPA